LFPHASAFSLLKETLILLTTTTVTDVGGCNGVMGPLQMLCDLFEVFT
jgi:hypothetical protein